MNVEVLKTLENQTMKIQKIGEEIARHLNVELISTIGDVIPYADQTPQNKKDKRDVRIKYLVKDKPFEINVVAKMDEKDVNNNFEHENKTSDHSSFQQNANLNVDVLLVSSRRTG